MKLKTFILIWVILIAVVLLEDIATASTGVTNFQSYFVTVGNNVNSTYTPFTGGQTSDNSVPFVTLSMTDSAAILATLDFWHRYLVDVYFNSTGIIIQRTNGTSTQNGNLSNLTVRVNVVQFDTSSVKVQNGTFNLSGANTSVVKQIGTNVNASATALIFYYNSTDVTDDWLANKIRGNITNTSSLNFTVSGKTGVKAGHWYVFESLDGSFSVQNVYIGLANASAAPDTTSTIINSVQTNKTFLIASYVTNENSDDSRDGAFALNLTNSTAVTAYRNVESANVVNTTVFVITFTGDEFVQRGTFDYPGTTDLEDVAIINTVNTSLTMAWDPILTGLSYASSTTSPFAGVHHYLNLTNSTAITGHRDRGLSNDAAADWEVIQWVQAAAGGGTCWTYDSVGKMLIIPTDCVFNLDSGGMRSI